MKMCSMPYKYNAGSWHPVNQVFGPYSLFFCLLFARNCHHHPCSSSRRRRILQREEEAQLYFPPRRRRRSHFIRESADATKDIGTEWRRLWLQWGTRRYKWLGYRGRTRENSDTNVTYCDVAATCLRFKSGKKEEEGGGRSSTVFRNQEYAAGGESRNCLNTECLKK